MIRYENENLRRIELLLEKLLAKFAGEPEEAEITKCLKDIRKNKEELKGEDFL